MMAVPWDQGRVRNVKAVKDAVPDLEVVWDQSHDAWDTYLRTLEHMGSDPAVMLEDDIILTSDWRSKVEAEIAQRPDDVIQFFSMRQADLEVGSRWEPGRTFLGNLCWYLPAFFAAELRRFFDDWGPKLDGTHPTGTDLAVADCLKRSGRKYWLVCPNLVDHAPGPSMINPRRPPRASRSFVP